MNKVFLSHSSLDKEYIRIVARHLGRANILFDENNFDISVDFRRSIVDGLAESKVFVFFASKKSLSSFWCKYEIEKAELLRIKEKLSKCICIIIDGDISHKDIPLWLQESRILIQPRPSLAYRDILHLLIEMIDDDKRNPYIGRDDYKGKIKEIIANLESNKKQIFVFSGLDGIGKRQVYSHSLPELLDLREGPYYILNENSTLEDLYLMLIEDTLDLFDKAVYLRELEAFRKLSDAHKIIEISGKIILLCRDGFLPCFIDQGSLLQDNGSLKTEIRQMLQLVIDAGDYYIAIHERRHIYICEEFDREKIEHIRINPLTITDITILLKILLKRKKIDASDFKLKELASFIDGYPPAAYFSSKYSEEYGIDVLLADKSMLIDFKARRFSKFVSELHLSDTDWSILRYLASENYMQLDVLAESTGMRIEQIAPIVKKLIDLSLVVYIDEKYGISRPIRDSVTRAKGLYKTEEYDEVAERLTKRYWQDDRSCPYLEIVDATINAVARSSKGNIEAYTSFFRLSTLVRIAQEKYYEQDWDAAIEYAMKGLHLDRECIELEIIIFKAYSKQEKWDNAAEYLEKIRLAGHKHYHYLEGFMLKGQRKYEKAIEAFNRALASGDNYYAVIRDFSDCLYRVGEYAQAFKQINQILKSNSENIFVLDLAIRIAVELGDFARAEELLNQLERCDIEYKFIHTRKASYYVKLKRWDDALENINRAIDNGLKYFEVLAEKANILVEKGQYLEADEILERIKEKHKDQRHDVQAGLKCKLLSRQGRWREAYACWDNLHEKGLGVHLSLLSGILDQKVKDFSVGLEERNKTRLELESIKKQLRGIKEIEQIEIEE